MVDVSYVGNHGFNRLRAFQGGANGAVDLNAVDIGAAYLPQNQDPTLGPSACLGASAYTSNLLRAFRGFGNINEQETRFWDKYHGIQMSLNRRFAQRSRVRHQLQPRPVVEGQHRLAAAPPARGRRHDLGPLGSGAVRAAEREPRAAASRDQELCGVGHPGRAGELGQRREGDRSATGSCQACSPRALRISRVRRRPTARRRPTTRANGRYDLTYTYQNTGTNVNLTGSPDYAAKIVFVGDPGSGCSSNQYAQFNTTAVTGPTLRQRRPRIGPQHPRRLSRSHRGHDDCQEHPVRRQPQRSSSASTCSTCSTPSSTTTATAT